MILSLAAVGDGKHRPSIVALYDIVTAFVHATTNEVLAVLAMASLNEAGASLLLKVLYGTRKF